MGGERERESLGKEIPFFGDRAVFRALVLSLSPLADRGGGLLERKRRGYFQIDEDVNMKTWRAWRFDSFLRFLYGISADFRK